MRRAAALFMLAAACLACDREVVEPGTYPPTKLPQPFTFEFKTVGVAIDDKASPIYEDGDMVCTDWRALKICSSLGEDFVSFELTNASYEPVHVLWSGASWIDEVGDLHPLARFPGEVRAKDRVVNSQDVDRLSPFPSEKTYLVPDRENAYYFTEPIVPWDLRSGDPDEKRWSMVESRTPVFLTVPILIAEGTRSVRFEFQIVPRRKG